MQYKIASKVKPEYGDWHLHRNECQLCCDSQTLAFPATQVDRHPHSDEPMQKPNKTHIHTSQLD